MQEAQRQIEQMKDFILAEAKDKASDINKKCEEDFSIEAERVGMRCLESFRVF